MKFLIIISFLVLGAVSSSSFYNCDQGDEIMNHELERLTDLLHKFQEISNEERSVPVPEGASFTVPEDFEKKFISSLEFAFLHTNFEQIQFAHEIGKLDLVTIGDEHIAPLIENRSTEAFQILEFLLTYEVPSVMTCIQNNLLNYLKMSIKCDFDRFKLIWKKFHDHKFSEKDFIDVILSVAEFNDSRAFDLISKNIPEFLGLSMKALETAFIKLSPTSVIEFFMKKGYSFKSIPHTLLLNTLIKAAETPRGIHITKFIFKEHSDDQKFMALVSDKQSFILRSAILSENVQILEFYLDMKFISLSDSIIKGIVSNKQTRLCSVLKERKLIRQQIWIDLVPRYWMKKEFDEIRNAVTLGFDPMIPILPDGTNLLCHYIDIGYMDMIKFFHQNSKIDFNVVYETETSKRTCLYYAKTEPMVRLLKKHCVDLDFIFTETSEGQIIYSGTRLHYAAKNGEWSVYGTLIDLRADTGILDSNGKTAQQIIDDYNNVANDNMEKSDKKSIWNIIGF